MTFQDQVVSVVRTFVLLLVGFLVTWLAEHLHIIIDPGTQAQLVALFMLVFSMIYYVIVRALEHHFPWFGVLLGIPKPPVYPSSPGINNHPLPYRHD